jgi:hypothetical protein
MKRACVVSDWLVAVRVTTMSAIRVPTTATEGLVTNTSLETAARASVML